MEALWLSKISGYIAITVTMLLSLQFLFITEETQSEFSPIYVYKSRVFFLDCWGHDTVKQI